MSLLLTLFGDIHNCCTDTELPTNAETVDKTHHVNLLNILGPKTKEITTHMLIANMVESQWQLKGALKWCGRGLINTLSDTN